MRLGLIVVVSTILILMILLVNVSVPHLLKIIPASSLELKIKSLTTDKNVYHSKEKMNITLDVYVSEDVEADVKVFGIKDRRNNYRLNEVERRNLTSGINTISYSYTTPSCYGCAGIIPGTKQITALVSCENVTDNKTIEIQIER